MFGRECTIPIDLIHPNRMEITREKMDGKEKVPIQTIENKIEKAPDLQINDFDIMPDVPNEEIEQKMPSDAYLYLKELQAKLNQSYRILEKNKMLKMNKAKHYYDRRIRKAEYKIGDWVLCNHPHIKKGLSRGLAIKYHGPFIIVGKYDNGCDYLIRPADQPKARVRQVHQNNLKIYHKRGHALDKLVREPVKNLSQPERIELTNPTKRPYNKDPKNPRWKNSSSESEPEDKVPNKNTNFDLESPNYSSGYSAESESDESEPTNQSQNQPKKKGRPKGSKSNSKQQPAQNYVTKSGRLSIRPQ